MKRELLKSLPALPIATSGGRFLAVYSERGLAEIRFPGEDAGTTTANVPAQVRAWHAVTTEALKAVLNGQNPGALPPFDLSSGTAFQQSVWKALVAMPCGSTSSYGRLAASIGRPKAVRAVGRACGANPIPLLVPCHRILTSTSGLGGFSGGLDWKRKLLQAEGVAVQ